MEAKGEIGKGAETLRRIAALLLAMAVLAERAAFAPDPERCRVLLLLFRALAVAQELCTANGPEEAWLSPEIPSPCRGFAAADAVALAGALPSLALLLHTFAAAFAGPAYGHRHQACPEGVRTGCRRGLRPGLAASATACVPVPRLDSS